MKKLFKCDVNSALQLGSILLFLIIPGCVSESQMNARHYRGVVLDAETNLPIDNVEVKAFKHAYSLTQLSNGTVVGQTRTDGDGHFDFTISSSAGKIDRLEVEIPLPNQKFKSLKAGTVGYYSGVLEDVSYRHFNTILARKSYMEE